MSDETNTPHDLGTPSDAATDKQARLTSELQAMVAASRKGQDMLEEKSLAETVTKPESRRYGPDEKYTFLVHAPLDIASRTAQLGIREFVQTERPLNASLIDQEHNWTFEGMSGLIIAPPASSEDVLGAWSYDSGLNDMVKEDNQPSPRDILAQTRPDNYNQVNIRRGRVEGIYIRTKEDGTELDNHGRNAQLREFARQNNLPVAEIVVTPQEFADKAPEIHRPTPDLTTVEFSANGKKFRVDALLADPNRPLHGDVPTEGFYFRAREIDGYGQAGGDVVDPNSLAIIINQISSISQAELDEPSRRAIIAMINRYSGSNR